jgi:NAD(P)-dependent dehydrogenase (short-subunit alcohol dehydrogenase family)
MTTLVTGAGLIGAAFAREALRRGEKIVFVDLEVGRTRDVAAAFAEHECIDKYRKVFRYAKSEASAPDGILDHAEIGM